jgi:SurA N-terminal domain
MSLRKMLLPALIAALLVSVMPCLAGPDQTASRDAASRRTIDRVVASVDGAPITQSDVEAEYRTEVFLEDGRVPSMLPDAKTLSQILERLIDQKILMGEVAAEHMNSAASQQRAEQTLADLRNQFSGGEAFQAALRSLGLNEHDLLARIEEQESILRFVDQRMRPLVSVGHDEIEAYYRTTFLAEWAKKSKESTPALADVEAQIQEILVQRKIDQQLEVWLKELRAAHHVLDIT